MMNLQTLSLYVPVNPWIDFLLKNCSRAVVCNISFPIVWCAIVWWGKCTQEKTTLLDVSISKRSIAIQAAVAHSIEQREDTKWLCMYMYMITEDKVCTHVKTRCNALFDCVLGFYRNNVGRLFLLRMPIWVDVTACFWPISCVYSSTCVKLPLSCTISLHWRNQLATPL